MKIIVFIDPQFNSAHSGYQDQAIGMLSVQPKSFPTLL